MLNSVKAIGRGPGVFQRTGPFRFFKRLSPLINSASYLVRLCNSGSKPPFSPWRKQVDWMLLCLFPWQKSSGLISILLFALAGFKWGLFLTKEKCLETFYCHLSVSFYIAAEIIIDHIAISDVALNRYYTCENIRSNIFRSIAHVYFPLISQFCSLIYTFYNLMHLNLISKGIVSEN